MVRLLLTRGTMHRTPRLHHSLGPLAPTLWLGLALTSCEANDSDARSPHNANYGEETIGYKVQSAGEAAPVAANAPALGANAAAPGASPSPISDAFAENAEAPGDFIGADVGEAPEPRERPPEPLAPLPEPPPTDPALPVAPPSDAGPNDAGAADAAPPLSSGDPAMSSAPSGDSGTATGISSDAGAPPSPSDAGAAVSTDAEVATRADAAFAPPLFCEIPDFDELPETERLPENPFRNTADMPASTFSIDVDTGSYTLARAALTAGTLPARDSVRIEEFINYFHLHYAQPKGDVPFSVYSELADCPWNESNELLMVGVQGQEVPLLDQPPANLVFLLDVSGSMSEPGKLPLLKQGFRMITKQLRDIDTVSIVTYSTTVNLALEAASGRDKQTILDTIDGLYANGSTAGEAGVQLAYDIAQKHFIPSGNNRVLLATDGDFNVGINTVPELSAFIAEKRDTGVFLSVYGFGSPTGNFQDEVAEQLADNGNGIYFFVDSPEEARRAFVHTLTGSLLTVAKDVKLQLQFNPAEVKGYRLVGYENRVLSNADFANDSVDAGELGAGLSVTAFFEIMPAESAKPVPLPEPGTDPLDAIDSASEEVALTPVTGNGWVEVRIRYKGADESVSQLLTSRLTQAELWRDQPSLKFSFAAGVAEFAMQLRGSQYLTRRRDLALLDQIRLAFPADTEGAVRELHGLAEMAWEL